MTFTVYIKGIVLLNITPYANLIIYQNQYYPINNFFRIKSNKGLSIYL